MRTGRILVRAGWAAFIILCGFSIYSLYRGYQDAGLSLPLVLAVLAAWGISFVMVIGNEFSGRYGLVCDSHIYPCLDYLDVDSARAG